MRNNQLMYQKRLKVNTFFELQPFIINYSINDCITILHINFYSEKKTFAEFFTFMCFMCFKCGDLISGFDVPSNLIFPFKPYK